MSGDEGEPADLTDRASRDPRPRGRGERRRLPSEKPRSGIVMPDRGSGYNQSSVFFLLGRR